MIALIVAVIFSYLLGSIPASLLIAKVAKGVDIRKYGSGNVGATNVLRTAGKIPALLALAFDILKGVIPVTIISSLFYKISGSVIDYESFRIFLGFAAICGHIWPVFLNFKGGKGVATSTGVFLVLSPKGFIIAAIVWFATVLLTRYVSLGSLLASITLPIAATAMGMSIQFVIFTITICIISSYRHKSNIVRLINGEEEKIGKKVSINS